METTQIDSNGLVAKLADLIVRVLPRIQRSEIHRASSLTQDLGLDSLELANVFAVVKVQIADVDLTPWFLASARRGSDSLGSLADYLSTARERAA